VPPGAPPPPLPSVVHAELPPVHGYPATLTYANLIAENRRKSVLLVAGMIGLLALVGAALAVLVARVGSAQDVLSAALLGGLAFAVVAAGTSAWAWFGGANAILKMAGAKEIVKRDDPQLFNVVEELAIAAGLPMPKVYLIPDDSLNAFATGRDPANAAVAITAGLRRELSRDELAGVMAHEMAHVRHYDIRLSMLMATLAGLVVFASDLSRTAMRAKAVGRMAGGGSRGGNQRGGDPVAIAAAIVALLLLVIAPLVAVVIRLALSRQREYLADAGAVELTRYPQGLIGALEKLGACRRPLRQVNESIAPLFIVNPAKAAVERGRQNVSSVFLTHPPLDERINRLRALL
jgi:heat shock protein HtpX